MTIDGMHLSQTKYIKDLLDKVQLTKSKRTPSPIITCHTLSKIDGIALLDATQYETILGA